ncbi:MAG: hypothetical protein H7A01_14390 [Hahellaceae bacterium]|nr:hypothetical protein [Hahellaceae bacterium]MCP5210246.1 hypothetical protein [Hahellaceae bacterium]
MQSWYRKSLGDAMFTDSSIDRIIDRFHQTYSKEAPLRAAIYYRHETEGRLHCEMVVYFTPATVALALALEATPCQPPETTDLTWLIGVTTAA